MVQIFGKGVTSRHYALPTARKNWVGRRDEVHTLSHKTWTNDAQNLLPLSLFLSLWDLSLSGAATTKRSRSFPFGAYAGLFLFDPRRGNGQFANLVGNHGTYHVIKQLVRMPTTRRNTIMKTACQKAMRYRSIMHSLTRVHSSHLIPRDKIQPCYAVLQIKYNLPSHYHPSSVFPW